MICCIVCTNGMLLWYISPLIKLNRLIVYLNKKNGDIFESKWVSPLQQKKLKIVHEKNPDKIYSIIKTNSIIQPKTLYTSNVRVRVAIKVFDNYSARLFKEYFAEWDVKFVFSKFFWHIESINILCTFEK